MKSTIILCRCISDTYPFEYGGKLDNGKWFYLLFYFGRIVIRQSEMITDNLQDAINGEDLYWHDFVDEQNMDISEQEIMHQLSNIYQISRDLIIEKVLKYGKETKCLS